MKNQISRWVGCLGATLILVGTMAQEAVAEGDKEAKRESRRLQAQLSAAQKEKGILTTQLEALKKQLGDIESKGAALEKKTGGQRKQLVEMSEKYEEADSNLQYMTQLYTESVEQLQQAQKEQVSAQQRHEGDIHVCEKKNAELYRISADLMDKYQSKGFVSVVLLAEPFTQIANVEMQSLMQEYKDKSNAAKLKLASDAAPSPVVESTGVEASWMERIESHFGSPVVESDSVQASWMESIASHFESSVVESPNVEASTLSDESATNIDNATGIAGNAAVVPPVEDVAASSPDSKTPAGSNDAQAAPRL